MNLLFPKPGKTKKRSSAEKSNWNRVRAEARKLSGGYCQNPFCRHSYHYVGQPTVEQCREFLDPCHIKPRNWGGPDEIGNIINLCRTCHNRADGNNVGNGEIEKHAGNKFMRRILAWHETNGSCRWSAESIEWLDRRIGL